MLNTNIIKESKFNINSVSYLNVDESELLILTSSREYFFGNNSNDFIDVGIYNEVGELNSQFYLTGSTISTKTYYPYTDVDGNNFQDFFYRPSTNLIQDLEKNILISIGDIVSASGISNDKFTLSLKPISNAFTRKSPLILTEVSNSRTELRFIKSYPSVNVNETLNLSVVGGNVLINGDSSTTIKRGIVSTLTVNGDINLVKFSFTNNEDVLNSDKTINNIVYKHSENKIIIDATEDIPDVLYVYNKSSPKSYATITVLSGVNNEDFTYNTEFNSLGEDNFIYSDIYDDVSYILGNFNVIDVFESSKFNFKKHIESLKSLLSISNNDGVLNLITSIYYGETVLDSVSNRKIVKSGIRDYILNECRFNFNFVGNFTSFNKTIRDITIASCKNKILSINPNVSSPTAKILYEQSMEYLSFIMDSFLKSMSTVEIDFKNKFKSPLKNALNLSGDIFPILIYKIDGDTLIVKLKDSIPDSFSVGKSVDLCNISIIPFNQLITLDTSTESVGRRIGAPNFSISPNGSVIRPTKYLTQNQLKLSDELDGKISVNKTSINSNVDYSKLENFVVFSSANVRLKVFQNKISSISYLNENIARLTAIDSSATSINDNLDVYNNISSDRLEISNILKSLDGYESFLYKSGKFFFNTSTKKFVTAPGSTTISEYVTELESLTTEYDRNNVDSLINNTPEYIHENSENDDYLKFLSLIGHHFDNIYVYISGIGVYKNSDKDESFGIADRMVNHILSSFGFKVPPGLSGVIDGSEIIDNYLSKSDGNNSNISISVSDKTRILWKRILANLPILYKTKGTEECIRHIFSIYGIPNNLITVREFGGGYTQNEISSSYFSDDKMYFSEFVGNYGEYVEFVNLPTYRSVDFKIKIDVEKYPNSKVITPIHSKFDTTGKQIYSMGFLRINQKLGSFYFIIDNESGSFVKVTEPMFLFSGETLSVMLRKNHVDPTFEYTSDSASVPTRYDICVHRNEYCVDKIDKKFSFYLSGSLNDSFDESGFVSFGNNTLTRSMATAELLSEIEYLIESEIDNINIISDPILDEFIYSNISKYAVTKFCGCMDKFTFQSEPLSDENFFTKCNNFNSYYQGEPSSSYSDILLRHNIPIPIDISYSSSLSSGYRVENSNKSRPNIYSRMFNFSGSNLYETLDTSSCINRNVSSFPHQTREFNIRNEYFTGEVGPSRAENNKINYSVHKSNDNMLSPLNSRKFKSDTSFYKDSNKMGIFVSPLDERNKDILNYFGDYEILSSISDPGDRSGRKYNGLEQLRANYYAGNFVDRVLFNELFTIYKIYVDTSVFDTIRNVLPARNKVYSGILIEPTILERNRLENRPIFVGDITTLNGVLDLRVILNDVDTNSDNPNIVIQSTSNASVIPSSNRFTSYNDYSFSSCENIKDSPDSIRPYIFVTSNGYVDYNGDLYIAYLVNSRKSITVLDNLIPVNVDKNFEHLELVLSGSTFITGSNYSKFGPTGNVKHVSRKSLPLRRESYGSGSMSLTGNLKFNIKSRQTESTTIGSNELGSSPIISISVAKNLNFNVSGVIS